MECFLYPIVLRGKIELVDMQIPFEHVTRLFPTLSLRKICSLDYFRDMWASVIKNENLSLFENK